MPFGMFDPDHDKLGEFAYRQLAQTIQQRAVERSAPCWEMPVLGVTLRIIGNDCISDPSWKERLNRAGGDPTLAQKEIAAIFDEWQAIRHSTDGLRQAMLGTHAENLDVRARQFIDGSWAEPAITAWLAHAVDALHVSLPDRMRDAVQEEWNELRDFLDVFRTAHVTYFTNLETPQQPGNIPRDKVEKIEDERGAAAANQYFSRDRQLRIAAVEEAVERHHGWPSPYSDSVIGLLCEAAQQARAELS